MANRGEEDRDETSRGDLLRSVGPALIVIAAFALGMLFGRRAPITARWSGRLMDALMGVYSDVAPLVIFFTAVPILARMARTRRSQVHLGYVLGWLAWKR